MKLIINIPDKKYNAIKEYPWCYTEEVFCWIKNGKSFDEEKLDLIGCGVNIGSRWSKQKTIAELEKIKEEIKRAVSDFYMENSDIAYGLTVAECILNKHISELKGGTE